LTDLTNVFICFVRLMILAIPSMSRRLSHGALQLRHQQFCMNTKERKRRKRERWEQPNCTFDRKEIVFMLLSYTTYWKHL